jgi:hypothetical protein
MIQKFKVTAGRVVARRVEQKAIFLVRAENEADARRRADEIVADEDQDRIWADEDLIEHDEVEATRVFSVEPVELKGEERPT